MRGGAFFLAGWSSKTSKHWKKAVTKTCFVTQSKSRKTKTTSKHSCRKKQRLVSDAADREVSLTVTVTGQLSMRQSNTTTSTPMDVSHVTRHSLVSEKLSRRWNLRTSCLRTCLGASYGSLCDSKTDRWVLVLPVLAYAPHCSSTGTNLGIHETASSTLPTG